MNSQERLSTRDLIQSQQVLRKITSILIFKTQTKEQNAKKLLTFLVYFWGFPSWSEYKREKLKKLIKKHPDKFSSF